MHLGDRIRELRGDLPQSHLADKLGVSRATVNGWELGRYGPSRDLLPALAGALNVTIDDLLLGHDVPVEGDGQNSDEEVTA